jgi:hypothetical protein
MLSIVLTKLKGMITFVVHHEDVSLVLLKEESKGAL